MSTPLPTGVISVCGTETKGEIRIAEGLLGMAFKSLVGGAKIFALSKEGCFDIDAKSMILSDDTDDVACGKEHFLAVTSSGQLYSWGEGMHGELGLGSKYFSLKQATPVPHAAKFTQVACGSHHSAGIDDCGNLYTWGQNFDRQLGLYRKKAADIPSHCLIEDVVMLPRLVPITMQQPLAYVACGSNFTLAVTKSGEVLSWGAGECGQLGTGRCTRRDAPEVCFSLQQRDATCTDHIIAVAAGTSHSLALTATGDVFSWGLNVKGQGGIGDGRPRFYPVKVVSLSHVKQIAADIHSSACIDSEGNVWTWGSGNDYRLMHGDTSNHFTPKRVEHLVGHNVQSLAFARGVTGVLVHTKATHISPTRGPQKNFAQLKIHGFGFWPTDTIIVKFTKAETLSSSGSVAPPVPPRSCAGKFVKEGVISCKPPKLAEAGRYHIQVAVNGKDFTSDEIYVHIYPEPLITSMSAPSVIDLRTDPTDIEISFTCTKVTAGIESDFYARIYDSLDESKEPLMMPCHMLQLEEGSATVDEADDGSITSMNSKKSKVADVTRSFVVSGIDISSLCPPSSPCVVLRTQFTRNGVDFSAPVADKIVCHWFNPKDVQPCCCPIAGQREITVVGEGFMPSSLVDVEALLKVTLSAGRKPDNKPIIREKAVLVRSERFDELTFTVPAISEFLMSGEKLNDAAFYSAAIQFRLLSGALLCPQEIPFYYFRPMPVKVTPSVCRRSGGTPIAISCPNLGFISRDAKVFLGDTVSGLLDTSTPLRYSEPVLGVHKVECTLPSLVAVDEEGNTADAAESIYVGLLLDGITMPDQVEMCKLRVFDEVITKEPIVAKGGATPGSVVTVPATGLVPSTTCIVRIRGLDDKYVDVPAEIDEAVENITFTMPDTVATIPPEVKGKANYYYIDVSIDGISFDRSAEANLLAK